MVSLSSRRVPINDNYETCERTCAKLRIYGNDLDPSAITKLLGIQPSDSQKKGETRKNSYDRILVFKIGGWFLSSEDHVQSKDVRRHLDWILNQLVPKKEQLLQLQETIGITMDVNCIWWSAFGDGGPTLWPEQMGLLAELNLECGFEIAFYGEDENAQEGVTPPNGF